MSDKWTGVVREKMEAYIRELGIFDDPEQRTDDELRAAIEDENAAAAWMARWEKLPTDEERQEAVQRLIDAVNAAGPARDDG